MRGAFSLLAKRVPAANLLLRLARDNSGVTAVEYALIAGSLSLAILVGIDAVGGGLNGLLNTIAATAF